MPWIVSNNTLDIKAEKDSVMIRNSRYNSLPGELVVHCLSVTRGITMADSPAHITHGCRLKAAGE